MINEEIPNWLQGQIDAYIADSNTRVTIFHNDETDEWLYGVVVVDEALSVWNAFGLILLKLKKMH